MIHVAVAVSVGIVGFAAFVGCLWVILVRLRARWYELLGVLEAGNRVGELGVEPTGTPFDLEKRRLRYMKRVDNVMRTMQMMGSRGI